jgi:Mg-chelatase subunit ChlD
MISGIMSRVQGWGARHSSAASSVAADPLPPADSVAIAGNPAALRIVAQALPGADATKALIHLRVSAATAPSPRRLIVLAVDCSGSMAATAAQIEGVTLTRLQLASICLQLTIQALGECL